MSGLLAQNVPFGPYRFTSDPTKCAYCTGSFGEEAGSPGWRAAHPGAYWTTGRIRIFRVAAPATNWSIRDQSVGMHALLSVGGAGQSDPSAGWYLPPASWSGGIWSMLWYGCAEDQT